MADTKTKKRKWVKADEKATEKPAFKPRDGATRRATLYDRMKAKSNG